jgi:hypothetical protein
VWDFDGVWMVEESTYTRSDPELGPTDCVFLTVYDGSSSSVYTTLWGYGDTLDSAYQSLRTSVSSHIASTNEPGTTALKRWLESTKEQDGTTPP